MACQADRQTDRIAEEAQKRRMCGRKWEKLVDMTLGHAEKSLGTLKRTFLHVIPHSIIITIISLKIPLLSV